MRSDMAKVLVERPRPGSRMGSRPKKSYHGQVQKQMRRCLETGDSPPTKETHWQRFGYKRHFNEHLSPLRRYLHKQLGRPWNKVHSEICANINQGNVVQNHILTHLYQYVERHVCERNGKIERLDGRPLHFWSLYYVCPRTRLLRLTPRPTNWTDYFRQHRGAASNELNIEAVHVVNQYHLCLKINSSWELVEVRPLPAPEFRAMSRQSDIILGRPVTNLTEELLRKHYGRPVYVISRRLLSEKELKQYPIPLKTNGSLPNFS
jgi:hypothetical protein